MRRKVVAEANAKLSHDDGISSKAGSGGAKGAPSGILKNKVSISGGNAQNVQAGHVSLNIDSSSLRNSEK